MIFTEFRFFVFLFAVFAIHWLLRRDRWRKWWLLAASYYFYGCWDWRFLGLILFSTGWDYFVARGLARCESPERRKLLMTLSLAANLGVLGFFKYFNFFADSFATLAQAVGLPVGRVTLEIVLPVGVSFYTFQSLSYTIDVYRRKMPPEESLLDFATFVAFFPQLVAGPIVRAYDFLPQLKVPRRWDDIAFRWAIVMFSLGFFKKACVSDSFAPYVDAFFANPAGYSTWQSWLAVSLYAAQIYCDFSGYSDMAIASAALLGYRLTDNFAWPYFAANITDFWRRWHISLSTWLRDYLYISLGGNRHGTLKTYRNLMITMLLGGLWHGASWNFVFWGFLHGLALAVHKAFHRDGESSARPGLFAAGIARSLTVVWVLLAWVPFRSPDFATTLTIYKSMLGEPVWNSTIASDGISVLWIYLGGLLLASYGVFLKGLGTWWNRIPWPAFALVCGLWWSLMLAWKPVGAVPFIYFQF
ncbi:MAG: MBOAT family O-acyltransferase [Planctomycetaceae bacterium]